MKVTNIEQLCASNINPYSLIPLKQSKIKQHFKHKRRKYIAAKEKVKPTNMKQREEELQFHNYRSKYNLHRFFD